MRKILAVMNDSHGGHSLGLMNPDVTLFDEDADGNPIPWKPKPTRTQEDLWKLYLDCIRKIYAIAGTDEIVVIHNGDECMGNKYPNRLVSSRISDQVLIAVANLGMWLQVPNVQKMRLGIGTGAHDFLDGSSTILVQQQLSALYPKKDVQVGYHGLANVAGVTVDYAHHGPFPGSREWLRGNVCRYYLQSLMLAELDRGSTPPDLVLRGHYHSPVDEVVKIRRKYKSHIYIVPSFDGMDDHAHQATRSVDEITFGMIAFEIVDGEIVKDYPLYETHDIRRRETL